MPPAAHVHDILSETTVDHPPFAVEVSDRMATMVCVYVFDQHRESLRSATHEGQKNDEIEAFSAPLGWTSFAFEGEEMMLRRERMGEPISCHGEPRQFEVVLVYGPSIDVVDRLLRRARKHNGQLHTQETKFVIFKWSAKFNEWMDDSFAEKRTIDSVVLDAAVRDELLADVDEFTDAAAKTWYAKHHIPYRRGYVFHGPPGTGKTSTITALTSYLRRNLYRVNLVAPGLGDDSLMSAMQLVPRESVVLFEDVDALFGVHREKNEMFSVTFSGLLNSIDGICDSTRGLIFMFTTNHVDRVDAALQRCGRIDRSFRLGHCSRAQLVEMFLRFYPSGDERAQLFASRCADMQLTPAEVQHHFIMHRKGGALEAATRIILEQSAAAATSASAKTMYA